MSFRQINKQTGNRLRQQLVDDVTRDVVEAADKGRGYEVDKGVYIQIEDEEIESLEIESSHTIDIDRFVPRGQIDERYLDSTYYIAPNDKVGTEAFAVIREAMRGKDMVALGRVVMAKRERVIALQPWDKGVLGTTLRYPYELRNAGEYFDEIPETKIPKEMLQLAEHILDTKAGDFDPSTFVDHYEEAVVEMLKHKQAGTPVSKQKAAAPASNVVNLMDALRKSVAAEKGSAKAGTGEKGQEGQARGAAAFSPSSNSRSRAARPSSRRPPRPSWSPRRLRRARSGSRQLAQSLTHSGRRKRRSGLLALRRRFAAHPE